MKAFRLLAIMLFVMAGALFLTGQNHAFAQVKQGKDYTKYPQTSMRALGDPATYIADPNSNKNWREIWCGNPHVCYRWSDTGGAGLTASDTLWTQSASCWRWHVDSLKVIDYPGPDSLDVYLTLLENFPCPGTPTMTQWGIIILVGLIVASGVFVMLRRRKAAVPA